jgi:hypothetical protein
MRYSVVRGARERCNLYDGVKCGSAENCDPLRWSTDNWVTPWLSRIIMCGAKFWSVPRALHVNSTKRNWYCLIFPNIPPWTPPKCPPHLIFRRMPSTLRSVSPLAASWQCQRCDRTNNSAKNKRRCSSCRAWRDGIAPSSAAGIRIADTAVAAARRRRSGSGSLAAAAAAARQW